MTTEKFNQLKKILSDAQPDAEKFYEKGNRAAGTRLRQQLFKAINLAKEIRKDVSAIKAKD